MSNKTNCANSAKTPLVKVENTNNNKPQDSAPVSAPAPSSEEPSTKVEPIQLTIEDKTDRPKFEGRRVPVTVQPDLSSKGWRDLPAGTILRITERFSDKAHSNGLPYWTGEIETPGRLIRFCDKTITEIKSWYGDTNIQRGGSHKMLRKGLQTPEDIDKAVQNMAASIEDLVEALNNKLEICGYTRRLMLDSSAYAYIYRVKLERERAAKLAEDKRKQEEAAKKQAAKDLKNASEADRIKAAEYLNMSNINKQIVDALQAGNTALAMQLMQQVQAAAVSNDTPKDNDAKDITAA